MELVKRLYERAPPSLQRPLRRAYVAYIRRRYARGGRRPRPGETSKARARREEDGFFNRFCQGRGLDVGHGGDPVSPGCAEWDIEDGDAHLLAGVPNDAFDFVYSSHTLEHLENPALALRNWSRVLAPGGHLILFLPDRDLYE